MSERRPSRVVFIVGMRQNSLRARCSALFLAVNRTHALTRKPAKSLEPAQIENISIFLSCQRIAEVVTAELTAASVG